MTTFGNTSGTEAEFIFSLFDFTCVFINPYSVKKKEKKKQVTLIQRHQQKKCITRLYKVIMWQALEYNDNPNTYSVACIFILLSLFPPHTHTSRCTNTHTQAEIISQPASQELKWEAKGFCGVEIAFLLRDEVNKTSGPVCRIREGAMNVLYSGLINGFLLA